MEVLINWTNPNGGGVMIIVIKSELSVRKKKQCNDKTLKCGNRILITEIHMLNLQL